MKLLKKSPNNKEWVAVSYDAFTFSGGEEHIRINDKQIEDVTSIKIIIKLMSSAKVMQLCMVVDAVRRLYGSRVSIELEAAYFPYARQDRVCVKGEALGASVMANIINSLNFDSVTVWDAHSDVTPALINNVTIVDQTTLISHNQTLVKAISSGDLTLVSPDAGAMKKTLSMAKAFQAKCPPVIAEKVRDVVTGNIIKTQVSGDIENKDLIIVDDICDGGRTFIELAKVLKAQGANSVALYVTHGIFSKGLSVFEGLIDQIYTTDSFDVADRFKNDSSTVSLTILNA